MTDGKLLEIIQGYHDKEFLYIRTVQLTEGGYNLRNLPTLTIMAHLSWMCQQILSGVVKGNKAHRWLGYIQGELRGMSLKSINELREASRSKETPT